MVERRRRDRHKTPRSSVRARLQAVPRGGLSTLQRARLEDREAILDLIEQHRGPITRMIRSLRIADRVDTHEVFHLTRQRIYDNFGQFEGSESQLQAWMCTVARNTAVGELRSELRHSSRRTGFSGLENTLKENGQPECRIENDLLLEWVLDQLSPFDRELLESKYLEEHSTAQLAARFGYSEGHTRRMIREAARRCARILSSDPELGVRIERPAQSIDAQSVEQVEASSQTTEAEL